MTKKKKTLEILASEWNALGRPFIRYTAAQTGLNGAIIACQTGCDIGTATQDAMTNLPFFAFVNLGYAKGVDYITRKLCRYGRLGANAFSLAVTGAFYTYAALTNDADPTIPSAIVGTIGLYLTNKQINEIYASNRQKDGFI